MAPLVLLLREPEDPDPYEEALRADGFRARSVPVLAFRFVNTDLLREAFARPERYAGLIATSPRAVAALREVVSPEEMGSWRSKQAYAVGEATAEPLRGLGFDVAGAGTGSASALAPVIAAEYKKAVDGEDRRERMKPLLFLVGNRTREVLPEHMRAEGVPFESLLVYETQLRPDVEVAPGAAPDWVVFFSPSGVEAVKGMPALNLFASRIVAIGPTTAEALVAFGRPPDAVAATPTPSALAEAVAQAARAGGELG